MKSRNKYLTYKQTRAAQYGRKDVLIEEGNTDLDNWLAQPYSSLKAIFYLEGGALLAHLFQYTNINPNFLTLIYIILGFVAGIFLSLDNETFILAGTIIFFSKGIIDFGDGLLARIKNKTSELGHVLDCWGALVGNYSFIVGLGMYLYNKYEVLHQI